MFYLYYKFSFNYFVNRNIIKFLKEQVNNQIIDINLEVNNSFLLLKFLKTCGFSKLPITSINILTNNKKSTEKVCKILNKCYKKGMKNISLNIFADNLSAKSLSLLENAKYPIIVVSSLINDVNDLSKIKFINKIEEFDFYSAVGNFYKIPVYKKCNYISCLSHSIFIDEKGNYSYCKKKPNIGNIKDKDIIKIIKNSIDFYNILNEATNKRNICKNNCCIFKLCKGGCPLDKVCSNYEIINKYNNYITNLKTKDNFDKFLYLTKNLLNKK